MGASMATMTSTAVTHFGWCDPAECYRDESYGDGFEAVWVHRSAPRLWRGGPGGGSLELVRVVPEWTERAEDFKLVLEAPDEISFADRHSFDEWFHATASELHRSAFPPEPSTGCPEWCTAAASADERNRRAHEWTFAGANLDGSLRRLRFHHGPIGKAYREQLECQEIDGTVELGPVVCKGRVREVSR